MKIIIWALSVSLLIGILLLPLWPDKAVCRDTPQVKGSATTIRDTVERMQRGMGHVAEHKNPGRYFAASMIPYCRAGAELSVKLRSFTDNEGLARLAGEMGSEDTSFVHEMKRWQSAGNRKFEELGDSSRTSFLRLMYEVRSTAWEDMEPAINGPNSERSYVTFLIAHNQGAVDMAKVLLIFETDEELRQLACRIIEEKQTGIKSMQAWLKTR
jgi:uncharacterized protein (DUF305 family)